MALNAEQTSPLLRLPNELLERVINDADLSAKTLLGLSIMTRRFYYICLSIYLARQGIRNPEEQCDIVIPEGSPRIDALTALRLASFITEIDHLSCSLPRECGVIVLLRHFARLEALLDRLASVKHVVLKFDRDLPSQSSQFRSDDDGLQTWSDGVSNLLNKILERGCVSLEVNGLCELVDCYSHEIIFKPTSSNSPSSIVVLTKAISNLFFSKETNVTRGNHWIFRRTHAQGTKTIVSTLSTTARTTSALRHLTIGSESLIRLPVLQWTYSALAASPIDSLKICDVTLHDLSWPIIHTLIAEALPTLPRLELNNIGGFSIDGLNQWIGSFSCLAILSMERLALPWYAGLQGYGSNIRLPKFPNLLELRAPAEWFLPSYDMSTHHLPRLQTLTLVFEYEYWEKLGDRHSSVKIVLANLTAMREQITYSVYLEVKAGPDLLRWMGIQAPWLSSLGVADWGRCVSAIVIRIGDWLIMTDHRKGGLNTERWLDLFSGLRRLIITSQKRSPNPIPMSAAESLASFITSAIIKKLDYFEVDGIPHPKKRVVQLPHFQSEFQLD